MNNSDETLKKPLENDAVLKAIADLSRTVGDLSNNFNNLSNKFDKLENKFDKLENKFDKLENFVTVQFDAVQEGIAYNSAKFDRLEAKFFDARSDIANMRADLKEFTQTIRKKEFV